MCITPHSSDFILNKKSCFKIVFHGSRIVSFTTLFSTSSSRYILIYDGQVGSIIACCCPRSWVPMLWYRYLWFWIRYGGSGGGVRQWGRWVISYKIIQVLFHFVQFWAMAQPGETAAGQNSAVWSIRGSIQKADSIRRRVDSISALRRLIIWKTKLIFPRTAWPSNDVVYQYIVPGQIWWVCFKNIIEGRRSSYRLFLEQT